MSNSQGGPSSQQTFPWPLQMSDSPMGHSLSFTALPVGLRVGKLLGMQNVFTHLGLTYLPSICSPSPRALARCNSPGPPQSSQRLLTYRPQPRKATATPFVLTNPQEASVCVGGCSCRALAGGQQRLGSIPPPPIVGSGYNLLLTLQSCARPLSWPREGEARPWTLHRPRRALYV